MCIQKKNDFSETIEVTKGSVNNIFLDCIGVITKDPTALFSLIKDIGQIPLAIRDSIFLDSLKNYILHVYDFEDFSDSLNSANLKSIAIALAEASPNPEADYKGNPELLVEYAKRIILLIDNCGTKQKALYIANLTRALMVGEINTKQFFQLSRCIRELTEEDLIFLAAEITQGSISRDTEFADEYRALGLLYETDDGFSYSRRAFELKKYALCYEKHVDIPKTFPKRMEPIIGKVATDEDVQNMLKEIGEVRANQEWHDMK